MEKNKIVLIKLLFFFLLVLAVGVAAWRHYNHGDMDGGTLKNWTDGHERAAPLIFVLLFAVTASVGFPATPFVVAGALLFGLWFGAALNAVGLTLGAGGAFWVSRFLIHGFVEPRLMKRKWFEEFNAGVKKNGLVYVMFLRLLPLIPYGAVNFAAGVTNVRFRSFFLGTAVGVLPHVFIITNAVVEAGEAASLGFRPTPGLWLAISMVLLAAVVPLGVRMYLKKRSESADKISNDGDI